MSHHALPNRASCSRSFLALFEAPHGTSPDPLHALQDTPGAAAQPSTTSHRPTLFINMAKQKSFASEVCFGVFFGHASRVCFGDAAKPKRVSVNTTSSYTRLPGRLNELNLLPTHLSSYQIIQGNLLHPMVTRATTHNH